MILVDTSVWIDHFHSGEPRLVEALDADEVGSHPLVIEELALGSMKNRATILQLLGNLAQFPTLTHEELMALVERRRLWGRGLSTVDVHLLGSVVISSGSTLWSRDKRLRQACRDAGVPLLEER